LTHKPPGKYAPNLCCEVVLLRSGWSANGRAMARCFGSKGSEFESPRSDQSFQQHTKSPEHHVGENVGGYATSSLARVRSVGFRRRWEINILEYRSEQIFHSFTSTEYLRHLV
jgi:hypothetical protein